MLVDIDVIHMLAGHGWALKSINQSIFICVSSTMDKCMTLKDIFF